MSRRKYRRKTGKRVNRQLLEACKPLGGYSELVYRVRMNKKDGYSNEDAIGLAMNSCIDGRLSSGDMLIVLTGERFLVINKSS